MPTNVPNPTFTERGYVPPEESAVLEGVFEDLDAAFGGNLNPSPATPQGQLTTTLTAIIGDKNDQFIALFNGVDPAYASGRLQDAIGRIYFISRFPAQATVATGRCRGGTGTTITVGALAQDEDGNLYACIEEGTIPVAGYVDLLFQCTQTGPIECPIGFLDKIYRAITGWDSIENLTAGTVGNDVESRAEFEIRRTASVAKNSRGAPASVLGALYELPDVVDAYVISNGQGVQTGASIIGSISGTTLTVTSVSDGTVSVGDMVGGTAPGLVKLGTTITALGSGTGGPGTYGVSVSQTATSQAMTTAPGGVRIPKNCLYVAVYGGEEDDVAEAIWRKLAPGCNTTGDTTVTVTDDSPEYNEPKPTYEVSFDYATATPLKFLVTMAQNSGVPADAVTLVRNAILAGFRGQDGGTRAKMGSAIFGSRYYADVTALGSWAQIYDTLLGYGAADQRYVLMPINLEPTLDATDITVTFI